MKRAILIFSDDLLVEILKFTKEGFRGTFNVMENGLPEDVKVIRAFPYQQGQLGILLESEKFKDIEKGKSYPVLSPPIFQIINKEKDIEWLKNL